MTTGEKILVWLPRTLSIGFALFLAVFALDVFGEYEGWGVLVPLFMHLIPSLVLLAIAAFAWKQEWFGALIFVALAIFYTADVGLDKPWSWYLAIPAPAALIGILFFISWYIKRKK